uniref:ASPSCR1 tether for SLC2A4, UBX domain containing n=1 Tax=Oryzias sinensis TaxID=183150 RepID=A0A8C7X7V4_9TELE
MAASGSTVTVLTPNGRRQAVKVTPNSPLLQVLEEVCGKNGFNPDEYGLKFQRTVLDLTRPWRFANLPNNAKLEMVTSSRKQAAAESQVRVALQMEDGSRLQDSFGCGRSLWELITHFSSIREADLSGSGSTPVCVYMRDEVSGEEALKKTSLKSLGLTGGSAIISTGTLSPNPPPTESPPLAQEEEEQAGPSEASSQPSSSVAPMAPFVPFSGGGQRLGGPGGGTGSSADRSKHSSGFSSSRLQPVDREPLIYHLDSRPHQAQDLGDLPDEFFEVTVDDVRKRFAQLKSERWVKLMEEAPLMTKSLREAQMKEKMERYPKVVLRVQFPDRHVLQGFFRPLETVGAVRHFVRTHLDDAQLSFYLFVAPPKTILDDPSVTLFQVRSSPVFLKFLCLLSAASSALADLSSELLHFTPSTSTPSHFGVQ